MGFKKFTREAGVYELIGDQKHFIPHLLPVKPALELDAEAIALYGQAMQQLGMLDEMMRRIPSNTRFLNAYIAKEAMLSSEIEGIHTTLIEVLGYTVNAQNPKREDTRLVCNYVDALNHALTMVIEDGLPIVSRVIRDSNRILLSGTNDDNDTPGVFRKVPVRVGQLIPPAAHRIEDLIANLELFINSEGDLPPLIKAGIAHVQFETIHPFLDGNGRIGRLLMVLMLMQDGLISQPLLYPSYSLKRNRFEYYTRLDAVRIKGDWEGWNKYFLRAIIESTMDALQRAKAIEALTKDMQETIMTRVSHNRETAVMLAGLLSQHPILGIQDVADKIDKGYDAAKRLVETFVDLGILSAISDNKRNKVYQYSAYIDILEKDFSP